MARLTSGVRKTRSFFRRLLRPTREACCVIDRQIHARIEAADKGAAVFRGELPNLYLRLQPADYDDAKDGIGIFRGDKPRGDREAGLVFRNKQKLPHHTKARRDPCRQWGNRPDRDEDAIADVPNDAAIYWARLATMLDAGCSRTVKRRASSCPQSTTTVFFGRGTTRIESGTGIENIDYIILGTNVARML